MMFTTDQSHLRRYLATLGVAIAAGTLSLAGLFLKLQQDLIVPRTTLAALTPTARAALLKRQEYLSFGTAILPWFVLVGFFGGVGLSAYGMIGWARRQKIIDEREDIGLRKERVELRQLTDAEKVDKLNREVKESANDRAPNDGTTRVPRLNTSTLTNLRTKIATVERVLAEKLGELYGRDEVLSSARVQSTAGQMAEVDAVARPGKVGAVIFELKYASNKSARTISSRIADGFRQLVRATGIVLTNGVFVLIVTDDSTPEEVERWSAQARQHMFEHPSVVGSYVGRYSDFLSLPAKDFALRVGLDVR